jgi:hypothetical protein
VNKYEEITNVSKNISEVTGQLFELGHMKMKKKN